MPSDSNDGNMPYIDVAFPLDVAAIEVVRGTNDPSGDSDNIGRTRRQGLGLQVNLSPGHSLDVWPGCAWQDSKILAPDPAAPAGLGREIDHEPHRVFSAGVQWQATEALRISAGLHGQSDYWLERNKVTPKYGDSFLAGLHPLHSGEALGLAGRWLVPLSGLLPAALFTTGLIRWRHKVRARLFIQLRHARSTSVALATAGPTSRVASTDST